ncbi:type II secretion system minor pseudopilin GspJ [Parvularcula maris]|uniref:Type II secretion system protein J n=1 Tax=Parvularcula maris TaxID=2965077 RepID=A0A9X2L8I1_9PROT|nr:type II secretion system minor pseudopilin GspJ [Parvularcula maris]MCQ8185060.1 type II secretion system minor pseudopilin GspJ [Parvularcula maris]
MKQRGLTLVEVLVALSIFSAVSAIGLAGFDLAARGSEQLADAEARIGELERLRGILRQDLALLEDRSVMEPDMTRPRPPLIGGRALSDMMPNEEEPLLALVRGGWTNPEARQPRSELQAVTYLLDGDRLIRRTRPFLDAVADTPYAEDVLLEGASELEITYRVLGRWSDEAGRTEEEERPTALRLRFTHPYFGEIENVFLIPEGRS